MKKILLLLLIVLTGGAYAQAQADARAPKFQFLNGTSHDFKNVEEQSSSVYVFKFKNTGKSPLIITNAVGSCGCTVPSFSKAPVLPGKTGEIKVTYNATAGPGPVEKTVFVSSNATTGPFELHVKGFVKPKK